MEFIEVYKNIAFQAGISYSDYQRLQKRGVILRRIALGLAVIAGLCLPVILWFTLFVQHASAPAPSSAQAIVAPVSESNTNQSPGAGQVLAAKTAVKATPVAIPAAPLCKAGNSFSAPVAPQASTDRPGFSESATSQQTYTVYGNSAADISSQVYRCTPVQTDEGRFAASTDYSINWAYNFVTDDAGLCRVNAASVTLATSQVLPTWQTTKGTPASAAKAWQDFNTHLLEHENGHLSLDRQYANKLLRDLQNTPAADCAVIGAKAQASIHSNLGALKQANQDYDANTGHGVSQGATLR
jgi:predicted secreted Zn-dependent protease